MTTMMDAPLSVTTTNSGGSRLAQMQARFQQKQMQEKEQKLLRLYESQTQRAFQRVGRGSAGSSSSSVSSSSSLGGGKVRQLFQERRHQNKTSSTGWDRSYPLEPLENTTKQRLQPSKSTGNLKVPRGTSLERSYNANNQYQVKTQARRSKSQVRPSNYDDDEDEVDYHYRRDEENNRIYVEEEQREAQYFNQHRIYANDEDEDIENEDPPFQQLDDDDDDDDVMNDFHDSSQVFKKLSNVGARYEMEHKVNNNPDKYKTYNATQNGIRNNRRVVGDKEDSKKTTAARVTAKPAPSKSSPSTKKPEAKVSSYTATRTPTQRTTPLKPDSAVKQTIVEPPSWDRKTATRKPVSENTEHQMIQRGPPPRAAAPRGPPSTTQSASSRTPSQASVPRKTVSRASPAAKSPAVNVDSTECKICGRSFAKDRIDVHERICSKTTQKKRKVFDPTKQRVKGTEAEQFLKKGKAQPATHMKKTNWRQKHEDFINSIRAAKEMKAHLAKGGKLSDLPPPPPSDYSDYVQCPHCSRRFNQQAAERHIPKCATFEFNKPKSQAAGAGRGRGAIPKKR